MNWIVGWIFGKVKWLLLIAAIGGPAMAYVGWDDIQRIKEVETKGVEARAGIENVTRTKRRRGGTSYTVDLRWTDDRGREQTAEKVSISSAYAGRILRGDRLVVSSARIKFLPAGLDKANVVILEDAGRQSEDDQLMVYAGGIAGAVGIAGWALILGLGRRSKAQPQPAPGYPGAYDPQPQAFPQGPGGQPYPPQTYPQGYYPPPQASYPQPGQPRPTDPGQAPPGSPVDRA